MVEKHNEHEEDIVVEGGGEAPDLDIEDEEILSADTMKKLRAKLRACEAEKKEHLDGWQRARADFLNYKRRMEEDAKRIGELHTARTVEKLLPLLDSFSLATKGQAWDQADASFKSGFEMIRTQLSGIFKDLKVEVIDPRGMAFDPHTHEAISEQEVTDESEIGTVIETVQPGYKIGDAVIRPARVIVGTKNG